MLHQAPMVSRGDQVDRVRTAWCYWLIQHNSNDSLRHLLIITCCGVCQLNAVADIQCLHRLASYVYLKGLTRGSPWPSSPVIADAHRPSLRKSVARKGGG